MHELMAQVAGVVKIVEMCDGHIVAIRANPNGAQITISEPLPENLELYVEDQADAGHKLWGVWITWETN